METKSALPEDKKDESKKQISLLDLLLEIVREKDKDKRVRLVEAID